MGGDANVIPPAIIFMFVRMVGADVVDLWLRSFSGPEHGRWIGRQQAGNLARRIADIAEDAGAADARIDT